MEQNENEDYERGKRDFEKSEAYRRGWRDAQRAQKEKEDSEDFAKGCSSFILLTSNIGLIILFIYFLLYLTFAILFKSN
ncbi:MAG: hypothetical protein IKX40_07610 [Thermoguttaceae bacterium]|nr:hypothetical protein [Thermoguttaceae bacterium]